MDHSRPLGEGQLSGYMSVSFVDRFRELSLTKGPRVVHAYILGTSTAVYIVFRGTDTVTGALLDEDSGQEDLTAFGVTAKVHGGFLLSLTDTDLPVYDDDTLISNSAYTDIVSALTTAAQGVVKQGGATSISKVPVLLFGHSLGASQAALTAYMLKNTGSWTITGVYAYGFPQTGDGTWASTYNSKLGSVTFRWWNNQDPVPLLPNNQSVITNTNGDTWFQVSTLYRIYNITSDVPTCGVPSGTYAECPTQTNSCTTDINFTTALDTTDHRIAAYEGNLYTCLKSQTTSTSSNSEAAGGRRLQQQEVEEVAAAVGGAGSAPGGVALKGTMFAGGFSFWDWWGGLFSTSTNGRGGRGGGSSQTCITTTVDAVCTQAAVKFLHY